MLKGIPKSFHVVVDNQEPLTKPDQWANQIPFNSGLADAS